MAHWLLTLSEQFQSFRYDANIVLSWPLVPGHVDLNRARSGNGLPFLTTIWKPYGLIQALRTFAILLPSMKGIKRNIVSIT